ncbi:hypothetical protein [Rheinheimera texasensis]|uniref:hypothetical protein n=1 Tax=Rheinheimera texasensis TaxID=306205 RepID=UPI0032B30C41
MAWLNANANWPASAQAISDSTAEVLNQVGGVMSDAIGRVAATEAKITISRHDLSSEAEALLNLRSQLNDLMVEAKTLTVTPAVYGLGNDGFLSTQQAINALAAKLRDNADRHTPGNQTHALVLLLSAASPAQLLSQLTPICNLLAVPTLLAYQRQLQKEASLAADKMQQNAPALTPRWTQISDLNLQPLRSASTLLGAQIAQLESLSADAATPLTKLTALANKRSALIGALQTDLTALQGVAGSIWRFAYNGSAAALATELQNTAAPVKQPVSVAMVISSTQPLTFFQELLQ